MVDSHGRPLCPRCTRPMDRAQKLDHGNREGGRNVVFACDRCDAVEIVAVLPMRQAA